MNFTCKRSHFPLSKIPDNNYFVRSRPNQRLPPSQGALCEAALCTHYQVMVWNNNIVENPDIPSPGCKKQDNRWLQVMTKLALAPEAIIDLVEHGCTKKMSKQLMPVPQKWAVLHRPLCCNLLHGEFCLVHEWFFT